MNIDWTVIVGGFVGVLTVIATAAKALLAMKKPGEMLLSLLFRGKTKLVKLALGADAARISRKFATLFKYDLIDSDLDELRSLELMIDAAVARLKTKHPGVI